MRSTERPCFAISVSLSTLQRWTTPLNCYRSCSNHNWRVCWYSGGSVLHCSPIASDRDDSDGDDEQKGQAEASYVGFVLCIVRSPGGDRIA